MRENTEAQFDDPALKAAIMRVAGTERAPDALRARMAGILREGATISRPERTRWLGTRPMRTLLAASVAILAIGLAFYQARQYWLPPKGTAAGYNYVIRSTLAEAMVQAHAQNAGLKPAATSTPADQLGQVQEKLSKQVGYSVLLPADLGDGWVNVGSGTGTILNSNAAWGVYSKAGHVITLFSFPASVLPNAPDGATYQQLAKGGALSGYKTASGLYCVVASNAAGAPDLQTLTAIREHLRTAGVKSCGHGGVDSVAIRI